MCVFVCVCLCVCVERERVCVWTVMNRKKDMSQVFRIGYMLALPSC